MKCQFFLFSEEVRYEFITPNGSPGCYDGQRSPSPAVLEEVHGKVGRDGALTTTAGQYSQRVYSRLGRARGPVLGGVCGQAGRDPQVHPRVVRAQGDPWRQGKDLRVPQPGVHLERPRGCLHGAPAVRAGSSQDSRRAGAASREVQIHLTQVLGQPVSRPRHGRENPWCSTLGGSGEQLPARVGPKAAVVVLSCLGGSRGQSGGVGLLTKRDPAERRTFRAEARLTRTPALFICFLNFS